MGEHTRFIHHATEEAANFDAEVLREHGWKAEVTRDADRWLVTAEFDNGDDDAYTTFTGEAFTNE